MAILEVSALSRMEEGALVVNNISFSQEQGQKLAIAGATGSGKTSLLKMIAGLSAPTSGTLLFEGKPIEGPNERLIPGHPSIAYLSQYFELRNHYRVKDFLSMAAKLPEAEADVIYHLCRISHLLTRWTHQLSGGEKQRIALARLLITSPKLLLLDEPFSNLDPFHKNILKCVIDDLSNSSNITCILVSHDPVDTLPWADEILVLKEGKLVQQSKPEDVYFNPVDEYVATLFGKYNVLTKKVAEVFSGLRNGDNKHSNFIRPHRIKLVRQDNGKEARIVRKRFMGSYYEIEVMMQEQSLTLYTTNEDVKEEQTVFISLEP